MSVPTGNMTPQRQRIIQKLDGVIIEEGVGPLLDGIAYIAEMYADQNEQTDKEAFEEWRRVVRIVSRCASHFDQRDPGAPPHVSGTMHQRRGAIRIFKHE